MSRRTAGVLSQAILTQAMGWAIRNGVGQLSEHSYPEKHSTACHRPVNKVYFRNCGREQMQKICWEDMRFFMLLLHSMLSKGVITAIATEP